jgi:hypothetical protein
MKNRHLSEIWLDKNNLICPTKCVIDMFQNQETEVVNRVQISFDRTK